MAMVVTVAIAETEEKVEDRGFLRFKMAMLALIYFGIPSTSLKAESQFISHLSENTPTVILPHSFEEYSLDPLDGIYSRNIWIMNLLYEKILKLDKNGFLISELLEKFSFDHIKNEITLTLKKNIRYSNNTVMALDDLILSILRVAFVKSDFCLTNNIVGIQEWAKHKHPLLTLPSGIIKSGPYTVTLKLSKPIRDPLYQLTKEFFFVIPSEFIDKKNGQMTQSQPPFSGKYSIEKSELNHILFRKLNWSNKHLPELLRLLYISPTKIIRYLDHYKTNHIIIAEQIYIPPEHQKIISQKFKSNSIPEFRFMALKFNTRVKPFNQLRVRQFFVKEFRKTLENYFGRSDGSLLTRIMPGYVPLHELRMEVPEFSPKEQAELLALLKQNPPQYNCTPKGITGLDPFQFYFNLTLKRLDIVIPKPLNFNNFSEVAEAWNKGQITIGWFFSGLHSNDPTESISFLFSNNMFEEISDVNSDPNIKRLVAYFRQNSSPNIDINNLKLLNKYLFKESIFSIVANYSFSQFTLKESNLKIVNDWTSDVSNFFVP